jgi:hypothetical protein
VRSQHAHQITGIGSLGSPRVLSKDPDFQIEQEYGRTIYRCMGGQSTKLLRAITVRETGGTGYRRVWNRRRRGYA